MTALTPLHCPYCGRSERTFGARGDTHTCTSTALGTVIGCPFFEDRHGIYTFAIVPAKILRSAIAPGPCPDPDPGPGPGHTSRTYRPGEVG